MIQISFDIDVTLFDVETAIPLDLIVNELVTNSIKYAFIESQEGHIKVKLWQNDQEQLCLLVSDDGQGATASEIERKANSFGSDLIKILSQKLKGKIEIHTDQGYATKITFDRYQLIEKAVPASI